MNIILKSLILSFGVSLRMILPILAISVASALIFTILSIPTLGLASVVSGPITTVCATLVGVRTALSLMGRQDRISYSALIMSSIVFGLFMFFATSAAVTITDLSAVAYADWKLGRDFSLDSLKNANEALQLSFAFNAFGMKAILGVLMYSAVHVVMAVPIASAARGAGVRAKRASFFHGFGRSFIPLFLIFTISFFLQFVLTALTAVFAIMPLLFSVMTMVFAQRIPDFDLPTILGGLMACAGLLWLQSWIWAASAVALVKRDEAAGHDYQVVPAHNAKAPSDIRALRKSRE